MRERERERERENKQHTHHFLCTERRAQSRTKGLREKSRTKVRKINKNRKKRTKKSTRTHYKLRTIVSCFKHANARLV